VKTEIITGILRYKKIETVRRFDVFDEHKEIKVNKVVKFRIREHKLFFLNRAIHVNVFFLTEPETRSHRHISVVCVLTKEIALVLSY